MSKKNKDKVSILILTHNAPKYVKLTLDSLWRYTSKSDINFEVIVLDNQSKLPTRLLLRYLYLTKKIHKLSLSTYNTLFAGGNNMMSSMVDVDSKLLLLLNSDVEIKDHKWLDNLIRHHKRGVSAYGVVEYEPVRADGWCYLIDTDIYKANRLDESYQWWWAVTKQQADLLRQGYNVQAVKDHESFIHHYGGKSGGDFKAAAGMNLPEDTPKRWFKDIEIDLIQISK